jgi:TatD DNase family protein
MLEPWAGTKESGAGRPAHGTVIDSHCHLADDAFASEQEAVIGRAREAGVEGALCIVDAGNSVETERAVRLRGLWAGLRVAAGVHPHQAGRFSGREAAVLPSVSEAIGRTGAHAIGEIGLDYHYDFAAPDVQASVFRTQARLALERGLPIVVHAREADRDAVRILTEEGRGALRGVFHCFTGTRMDAEAVLEAGFLIGVTGMVTFPRATDLRDVIAGLPLERLLVETDAPFLAPVPFRGTRNEPAHVTRVASTLAELFGLPVETIAARTTRTFVETFGP